MSARSKSLFPESVLERLIWSILEKGVLYCRDSCLLVVRVESIMIADTS